MRRKQRERQLDTQMEEVRGAAAELTVDSLSSEVRKADRGTWDDSVGLPELIRESIFSASLLQASIWRNTPDTHTGFSNRIPGFLSFKHMQRLDDQIVGNICRYVQPIDEI